MPGNPPIGPISSILVASDLHALSDILGISAIQYPRECRIFSVTKSKVEPGQLSERRVFRVVIFYCRNEQ